MNILPKKKWHVRTKENMARVRRDEAKAAEEEAQRQERIKIAENEDRIRRLRNQAGSSSSSSFQFAGDSELGEDGRSHINFFATEERMFNLETRNKEAEAEAKKALDDHEHKLGIKIKFADPPDSAWYEKRPDRPYMERAEVDKEREKVRKAKEDKERKEKKKKKKERKRRRSRSLSDSEDEAARRKAKIEKLREERLQREREEKRREFDLLHPEVKEAKEAAKKREMETKYNSQFNPEFARQNRYRK